jgi:Ca-activated chloride channel family protein
MQQHPRAWLMFFLSPLNLWLLLVLPLLPLAYVWLLRRRSNAAISYSSVNLVRAAAGRNWKRHVPPALLLLACTLLLLASARPMGHVTLPWAKSTIMLAIDVSLSMRVSDVKPTRMAAAQEAAKLFLKDLPRGIEVGLVTFAASSQVVQAATREKEPLIAAINRLQMQVGTAIGSGIVVCLAELFPEQGLNLEELTFGVKPGGSSLDAAGKPPTPPFTPVAPGSYKSAAIILLSDGRRTTGVDTLEAARMAADRGVRIYVVGLGTVDGDAYAEGGMPIYMRLDEPTLQEIARITGGEYYYAGTAEKLRSVYQNLGSKLQVQTRETELSGPLALLAALLALAAALLSVLWFRRIT